MAELTTKGRKQISDKNFALPGRRYPIEDRSHAANAKARVSQFGTPAEKAEVDRKVKARYGFAGGGETDDDEQDDSSDSDETTQPAAVQQPVQATPKATAGAAEGGIENLRSQLEEYLGKQRAGSDAMQQLASQYGNQLDQQTQRPDMRAFNALADYYYGTNLSKQFPHMTPAEATQAKMQAQSEVDKTQTPIAQELLRQFGTETSGLNRAQMAAAREQAAYFANQRNMASTQNKDNQADQKLDTDSLKELHKDKEYNAALTGVHKAPGLLDAVDQAEYVSDQQPGNPVARDSLATELGLYISKGQRLHQTTVEAMGLNRGSLLNRLSQIKQGLETGTLTPQNATFARNFIQNESNSSMDEANTIRNRYADDFAANNGRAPKWASTQVSAPGMPGQAPSTIERKDPKSGRIVIYDAKTKQPLRWK